MGQTLREKIISALIESQSISKEVIEEAIILQKTKKITLDKALIQKGVVTEQDLLYMLAKELHIPSINLSKYKIEAELKEIIPQNIARQYHIVPISKIGKILTVALSDPLDVFVIDDLKSITGYEIDVVMSADASIMEAIGSYYGSPLSDTAKDVSKDIDVADFEIVSGQASEDIGEGSIDESQQAPIIRMVNLIIKEALKQRASDIHVEPTLEHVRVRYRIDGILQDVLEIPKENQNAIIVRIKIMSHLDITANRVPQDGRFKMRVNNQEVDFRVSLLPITHGQKIVMRILNKKNLSIGLEGLGFSEFSVQLFKESITKPFGMVLVTGPTGSGKSTTLYSIINVLNTVERNIITVEDPVEYLVEGLTQIQVRPEIGLTFASGLRAMLRQSPDIVMVGEIRDNETADIAIKASLTGQLVFSTLHTNDAPGALTRLVDMGVEPFLVASSLVMVCAQRLCRKICPHCKTEIEIPEKALKDLHKRIKPGTKFYQGKGCEACRHTGYHGRIGITEVLMIDEQVREMLIRGVSSDEIKNYAVEKLGMVTLWEDAVSKFFAGLLTYEEVLRIASRE